MTYLFSTEGLRHLHRHCKEGTLLVFDYDGTLAPLVPKLHQAFMPRSTEKKLQLLRRSYRLAILTGRDLSSLKPFFSFPPGLMIGNHGLQGLPGHRKIQTQARHARQAWKKSLLPVCRELQGVVLEDKSFSLSIHYRQARDKRRARLALIKAIARLQPKPKAIPGKLLFNLTLAQAPDKGRALRHLMKHLHLKRALFVGDDRTDEDVFRIARSSILSVRVGYRRQSKAQWYLRSQNEIDRLLEILAPGPVPR